MEEIDKGFFDESAGGPVKRSGDLGPRQGHWPTGGGGNRGFGALIF